jgi:hypothetical protein
MEPFVEHAIASLGRQMKFVRKVPAPFFCAVALSAIVVLFFLWAVFDWRYKDRFESQSEQINLLSLQLKAKASYPPEKVGSAEHVVTSTKPNLSCTDVNFYIGGAKEKKFVPLLNTLTSCQTTKGQTVISDATASLVTPNGLIAFSGALVVKSETDRPRLTACEIGKERQKVLLDLEPANSNSFREKITAGAYELRFKFSGEDNTTIFEDVRSFSLSEAHAGHIGIDRGIYVDLSGVVRPSGHNGTGFSSEGSKCN